VALLIEEKKGGEKMTISEACQVWIEQRVKEELEIKEDTGKSLRAIGRQVAKEIERLFETKVNPRTLEKRAERMRATNVAPSVTPEEHEGEGVIKKKEDSDALFQMKRWWKKATKKDRRKFILWTKGEAHENGYGY
jgi:tyrosyl-tRNA synthetase